MVQIGSIKDFPEGKERMVTVKGIDLVIYNIDGDLYALSNLCPHAKYPLSKDTKPTVTDTPNGVGKVDKEEMCVTCPWHGMEFDLESGHNDVTGRSIGTFEVENRGGEVHIDL